tara:strand:- start:2290 stop:2562 length:273 start_codon:yes stop_codon:yes gene_type:complete
MPYKKGVLKDKLTVPELRRLVKAHNILMSIKIPRGVKRDDIIKLIEDNGYTINHATQSIIPRVEMKRKPKVTLKKANNLIPVRKKAEKKD